jgi:hypothetical protein
VKKIVKEFSGGVRKHLIECLLGSLGLLLESLWPSVKNRVLGLSLSDNQVLTIRAILLCSGLILISAIGWPFYLRSRKEAQRLAVHVKELEAKLEDSLKHPPKISDDYTFSQDRGFYIHKLTGHRVCGNCLLAPVGIESPLMATDYVITENLARYGGHPSAAGRKVSIWKCGRKGCEKIYVRQPDDK